MKLTNIDLDSTWQNIVIAMLLSFPTAAWGEFTPANWFTITVMIWLLAVTIGFAIRAFFLLVDGID